MRVPSPNRAADRRSGAAISAPVLVSGPRPVGRVGAAGIRRAPVAGLRGRGGVLAVPASALGRLDEACIPPEVVLDTGVEDRLGRRAGGAVGVRDQRVVGASRAGQARRNPRCRWPPPPAHGRRTSPAPDRRWLLSNRPDRRSGSEGHSPPGSSVTGGRESVTADQGIA